ncbi:MAG: TolC family protein [Chthoniobacterales bacterium]
MRISFTFFTFCSRLSTVLLLLGVLPFSGILLAQDTDKPAPNDAAKVEENVTAAANKNLDSEGLQDIKVPDADEIKAADSDVTKTLPQLVTDDPIVPENLVDPIPKPPTDIVHHTVQSTKRAINALHRTATNSDVATNAPPLTLDEAVAFALKSNPDILSSIQSIYATRGQLLTVTSQILPHITAASSYSVQEKSLFATSLSSSLPIFQQNQAWDVQIAASQLIYDGGAAYSGIKSARFTEDAAYFQLRQTIDRVVAEVKINFFQVILNRALIVAQEQSVTLLESQLQDQTNRFEAGTVPRFNVLQAEVALANAIPPLIQARNALRISQFQLVRLLGMNYPAGSLGKVPFNVKGKLEYNLRNIDTERSIRVALERSPLLKAQRRQILASAADINVAIAGYLPRIQAQGGYQWMNDSSSRSLTNTVEGWFFGVTGSWDIFDGLETTGRVKTAKAELEQSKILYDNSVREVILVVQESISDLQQARETVDSQEASVEQAKEALRLARERLDAGAGTQLDVLNARVQLLTSETTLLQAKFDYISALARYDAALALDTQYMETFTDPLVKNQKRTFLVKTDLEKPEPKLPRVYRNKDPLADILGDSAGASGDKKEAPAAKK